LNADELKTLRGRTFDVETQFDGLANTLRNLVEGPRLRVTSRKLRDRSNVEPFLVALYDDTNWRGNGSSSALVLRYSGLAPALELDSRWRAEYTFHRQRVGDERTAK
jgi:hypothetical protein